MSDYHEPWESLSEEDRNLHRALQSLKEELEAVAWYHQRSVLCADTALRELLVHNRDEEMEHACMLLEWLRRQLPALDRNLRKYVFSTAPIVGIEALEKDASK